MLRHVHQITNVFFDTKESQVNRSAHLLSSKYLIHVDND